MNLRWTRGGILTLAAIFLLVSLIYRALAGTLLYQSSLAPYFVDLADAFLQGRLNIENPANSGYDMIHFQGKWYVAQPPLPALLALPLVFVQGEEYTSDVAITVLCAALSVALCAVVVQRVEDRLSPLRWFIVVLLYGLGTVLVALAVMGTVWFMGQVVAVLCLWAMILCVISKRSLGAGLFAGLVLLSRPTLVPASLLFALGYWFLQQRAQQSAASTADQPQIRSMAGWLVIGLLPGVILLGAYNMARFGNPLDLGYAYILDSDFARERRQTLGSFHPAFFPENFYIAFVKPLHFAPECLANVHCGIIETDLQGAGLLWTSPALLIYGFAARPRSRQEGAQYLLYAIATLLALLPGLFYHNTGEAQFGYRFALDALPFAMLLVAAGARRGPLWLLFLLTGISIAVNVWGAKWLMNMLFSRT